MPELPEVETIKRDLEKAVLGKAIREVCIHHPAVVREPCPAKFKDGLQGVKIKKILRRAKVLILELSNGKSLVIHLKMTGQLIYPGDGKKSRVSFHFSDGKTMDFNDQRLFGELRLRDGWRSLSFIQGLGPEPDELTADKFKAMLSARKTKIKTLLLEQTFISGIGNLYVVESLFRAKIHPQRPASSLTTQEQEALFAAINQVLREAIRHGGSSVDDYVRLSGEPGEYLRYHRVYGREGKPCLICKASIKRITLGGRGTYFCPVCQAAPLAGCPLK